MKHVYRIVIGIWTVALFGIMLFTSLVPVVNNENFFQQIWREENICEQMNISEDELTKVINHTMDYMWDKNDDLQITITLKDGTQREFYQHYDYTFEDGLELDELGHMRECKVLFMAGKSAMVLCCITFVLASLALVVNYKTLHYSWINTTYFVYGGIALCFGLVGLYAALDWDGLFTAFHKVFFGNSTISWTYPWSSYMIQMLPETVFSRVVLYTLIHLFTYIGISLFLIIFGQKKIKKLEEIKSSN